MNKHEAAGNVDVFDSDKTCLFSPPTLSETNRARSEIRFIELFHGLFLVFQLRVQRQAWV